MTASGGFDGTGSAQRTVPVLYVEMNEDGTTGGSHVVMRDIITRIGSPYSPVALFYQTNPVSDAILAKGTRVLTWDTERLTERRAMETASRARKVILVHQQIEARRALIRQERVRLVHLGNSPTVGGDTWLPACLLEGIPCVVYSMGGALAHVGALRRRLYRRFDRILPNSRYLAESLSRWGFPTDRIVLAYPGLDFDQWDRMPRRSVADVRGEFGVADDQLLVSMIGNLREWKGQHLLVEAVRALLPQERERLRVLLVGAIGAADIPYAEALRATIREAGLETTVLLTGKRDDVPSLLAASDIAVHASVVPEPFGLVVLEAMAAGCAVIAARDGGPSEMLDAESGILVDTTTGSNELLSALRALSGDPTLRRSMAERAHARARRFDIHEHVRIVREVYQTLLG